MPELTQLIGLDSWRNIKTLSPEQWQDFQHMERKKDEPISPIKAYSPALDFDAEEGN